MTVDRPEPVRDLDWDPKRARAFTDGVAGIYEELLTKLRDLPVSGTWGVQEVRDAVVIPVPDEPMPEDELLDYLGRITFDYSGYLGHPRFYAYISGAGTVPGAAADLLASGLNGNAGGWRLAPAATEIELGFARWFAQDVFGLPSTSGGALTSGGAMANFIALKVARDAKAGWDIRKEGVAAGPTLAVYVSTETHIVSIRGADMLGLGMDNVRQIAVGDDYRIRVDDLRAKIAEDRAAGIHPFAVVANGAPSRPAWWIRSRRSRISAERKTSGSTSTPRTAAPRCLRTTSDHCSRASSEPTRSRSTRTNGSTRRSREAASWSATSS